MISLLLHKSEVKSRMSVNNKDILGMYLGYYPKDSTNQCFFVNSKQWLQVMFTYQSFFLILTMYSFDFFLRCTYHPRTDIYLSVLWLVISDISQYKTL